MNTVSNVKILRSIPTVRFHWIVDILHIHMHGGYYVGQQHKADFRFICDQDADDVSPSERSPRQPAHLLGSRRRHRLPGTGMARTRSTGAPSTRAASQ